jgi:calcineurin-like phosphoesterase family protein
MAQNKYVISDTHFGHSTFFAPNIEDVDRRCDCCSTVDEWDSMILDGINSRVGKSDTLYILGDFSFYNSEFKYRKLINCRHIFFVFGNHDNKNRCKQVFGQQRCSDILDIKICGVPTTLCHYPMFIWPKSHYGSYHLFGHVHDHRSHYFEQTLPEMRSLDVSPDSHNRLFGSWAPFSEEEIHQTLDSKMGHDTVEFYKNERLRRYSDAKILQSKEDR